jgi:hypothetical protein
MDGWRRMGLDDVLFIENVFSSRWLGPLGRFLQHKNCILLVEIFTAILPFSAGQEGVDVFG